MYSSPGVPPVIRDDVSPGFGRRTALKRGFAGAVGVLGFSRSARAHHERRDGYGTVVDVVDAGADPTGGESITPVIEEHRGDDTLLEFPDGRYYMDRKFRFTGFEHFGLVGTGDATLVPADYWHFENDQHKLFRLGTHYAPGRDLLVEGFTVDFTADDTGVRPFEATVSDGLTVRDVDIVGRHDSGAWGPGLFRVTDPGGSGLVERFRAPRGAAPQWETPGGFLAHGGPSGIICNRPHRGTIRFRSCLLGPFPDNGLYASGGAGTVIVDGGHYRNCGTAAVRVGADRAEISGTDVVVDVDRFGIPQEGIRLDYGDWLVVDDVTVDAERPNGEAINVQNAVDGASIRHSTVRMGDDAHVGVQVNPRTGPTYIEDVGVEIDGSNNAIRIEGDDAGEVGLEDVSVTGDAGGGRMRHAVYCERDGCDARRLRIDQPGGNQRRGLALLGDDAFVYDCRFTCTQRGISLHGSDAWIQSCYSEPYEEGRYSVKVFEDAADPRFKDNEFPDGILRA